MGLIDTHTHLESFHRAGTLDTALARAREAGVEAMVTIGTSPEDWTLYRDLTARHGGFIEYSVGLHPCSVDGKWSEAIAQIEPFWAVSSGPRPIALGEIGLDRFHLPKDLGEAEKVFSWQKAAFEAQLDLVKTLGCPVVIHSRGAFAECVEAIDASGIDWRRVVFHCFVEGEAEMQTLIQRGALGSFTGILTYKNAESVRAAAKLQGLSRFMLETDAPYLTPMPHRGKPNEPAFVKHTAEFAAGVFGVGLEEIAEASRARAKQFFGLDRL
jgi:TatD DNase family protein